MIGFQPFSRVLLENQNQTSCYECLRDYNCDYNQDCSKGICCSQFAQVICFSSAIELLKSHAIDYSYLVDPSDLRNGFGKSLFRPPKLI